MLKCFNLETKPNDVINLTDDIKQFVAESGIQSGECIVFNPHTTAGLTITSFWDPAGFEDLQDEICRLIPTRIDFKHQHDTPTDAAGHVKCSLLGVSIPLIIDGGKLVLGGSQGIFSLNSTARASASITSSSSATKRKGGSICGRLLWTATPAWMTPLRSSWRSRTPILTFKR